MYTLGDSSRQLMQSLDQDVTVYYLCETGSEAVSYTHLDVYKRQSRISAFALTSYGCNKSKLLSIPFTFENRAHFWNCLLYTSRCV